MAEKVYILVVNWNGWRDTLDCLESVFRIDYPDYQVVVCDNGSSDGSVAHITDWANGSVPCPVSHSDRACPPIASPHPKPIPYAVYDRLAAEAGGDERAADVPLVIIQTGSNLGFAGGNNVGLRYATARGDFGYVWLLNNDTVVSPDALSYLVARMAANSSAGQCGSTLVHYARPGIVQARGGVAYNRWFASVTPLGAGISVSEPADQASVERRMSYVAGASILVRRSFLRHVGLLSEAYFLYFEELDWATRGAGRFRLAYAPESIVYHKGGQSVKASGPAEGLTAADHYWHRNRLHYTARFFPVALPIVCLRTLAAVANCLRKGELQRGLRILRLLVSRESYAGPARGVALAQDLLSAAQETRPAESSQKQRRARQA